MLESLFNKVSLKQTPIQVFSCIICEIFNNTYFEEQLRMTASGNYGQKQQLLVKSSHLHFSESYFQKKLIMWNDEVQKQSPRGVL